jgi:hypothetical protein
VGGGSFVLPPPADTLGLRMEWTDRHSA